MVFSYVVLAKIVPVSWAGSVGSVASVTMFAGPLSALKGILKRKDSSVLSFYALVSGAVLASIWTLYGVTLRDRYVIVPNALGMCLAAGQLAVYFIYRPVDQQALESSPLQKPVDNDV